MRLSHAAFLWITVSLAACGRKDTSGKPVVSPVDSSARVSHEPADVRQSLARDIDDIRKRDTLVVLSPYNSTSYFLYRGEPMGYEYELLRQFAADIGVKLKLVVVQDRDSLFAMLNSGRGDIAAARLIPLESDSGKVRFTRALYRTDPVLVQQSKPVATAVAKLPGEVDTILKPGPAERGPSPYTARVRLVCKASELANQKVDLPKQSPYRQTLIELADSVSGDIQVVELDAWAETLIREVAKGNIGYTVTEGNLADLQTGYYKNIKVRPVIGQSKKVAWAVRRNAPLLLAELTTG